MSLPIPGPRDTSAARLLVEIFVMAILLVLLIGLARALEGTTLTTVVEKIEELGGKLSGAKELPGP